MGRSVVSLLPRPPSVKSFTPRLRPAVHVGSVLLVVFLLGAGTGHGAILWDEDSTAVVEDIPFAGGAGIVNGVYQIHVSPGGTTFLTWVDLNGHMSDSTLTDEELRECDSRLAFPSNSECPSYGSEYTTPGFDPIPCRYYYLDKYMVSIYVRARYPDGALGPIEEVNPEDPDSMTSIVYYDAAVGPDGSLHVVWDEGVPNVLMEPAPYSNNPDSTAAALPLGGNVLMYNRCGRDLERDGAPDSVSWITGPNDSICNANCFSDCDEYDTSLTDCTDQQPCWRQLANLRVMCYRRRYPTGQWSPIHRNIARYTDLNEPDTLRTTRVPKIAVDSAGWVYVLYSQKSLLFPSCAWRSNRSLRPGPGGKQGKGEWNIGQYDCFLRKWNSNENPDGPTSEDPVVIVAEDPQVPTQMPALPDEYPDFQSDDPVDLLVIGSGNTAQVHAFLCRCPTIGLPTCAPEVDHFLDQDLYVRSTDGGQTWSERLPVTPSLYEQFYCPDSCGFVNSHGPIEMSSARFLKNSTGPVHALFDHEFHKLDGNCTGCPHTPQCIGDSLYGFEVLHREITGVVPGSWNPPYATFANRLAILNAGDPPQCRNDGGPNGVIAQDGSMHAFWRDDADSVCGNVAPPTPRFEKVHVFHSELVGGEWTNPDTVMTVSTSGGRAISLVDIAETNGIFHMLVGHGLVDTTAAEGDTIPDGELTLSPDAGGHGLYYKRGVLAPEHPDTLECDTDSDSVKVDTTWWGGSIKLCDDFTVDSCKVLVLTKGTTVIVEPSSDVDLVVYGKLVCEGTSGEPVVFRSERVPERATAGDWNGIRLLGGSARARLHHTSVSGAVKAIWDAPGSPTTTAACAANDVSVPAGTLWIEDCRFAYNEDAGVHAEGDSLANTPDKLHVQDSRFLTNYVGMILRHVQAPGTSGEYGIRDNEFRFNDYGGLQILGKYGRKMYIAGNLFQGLGADEFVPGFPDEQVPDNGIYYDETINVGARGDTLGIVGNTFFRIEGAGIKADFNQEQIPGIPKTRFTVGGDTTSADTYKNLFVRVGTGIDLNFPVKMVVRGNEFLYYATGVHSTNHKPDLGGGTEIPSADSLTANYFYVQGGEVAEVDWPQTFNYHIDSSEEASTFFAGGNFWSPVQVDEGDCIPDAGEEPYYFNGAPILLDGCLSTLPIVFPTVDKWDVMSEPLKRAGSVRTLHTTRAPATFFVTHNAPNPFRDRTRIRFGVPRADAQVDLSVFDVQGRRVRALVAGSQKAGVYEIEWNGLGDDGKPVASGIYFYRLRAKGFEDVKRLVLMR